MHIRVTAIVVVSLTAACGQPGSPTSPTSLPITALTDPAAASPAVHAGAATTTELPFKGRLEGRYQGSGAPPVVTVHVEAEGEATHLGRFGFDSVHDVNFIDLTGLGTATLVAANGDTITLDLNGTATSIDPPNVFFITETLTITGGTGRFAGGSGTIVIERTSFAAGPDSGTTSGSMTGTLVLGRGRQ